MKTLKNQIKILDKLFGYKDQPKEKSLRNVESIILRTANDDVLTVMADFRTIKEVIITYR